MRLPHTPGLVRRHLQYLGYRAGIIRSVRTFGDPATASKYTIVIPDSIGDVAVNSGVTRAIRVAWPSARITLITDRRYLAAAEFNPDYDAAVAFNDRLDKPAWALSYRDQLAVARALTPDMDVLYLCQPGVWCDALFARYQILNLQHELCRIPSDRRLLPRLTLPPGSADEARAIRSRYGENAIFIAPGSVTLDLGQVGELFFDALAISLAEADWSVFWNGPQTPPGIDAIIPVGGLPLRTAVALASLCQLVVSARSGLSDLIALSCPELPHYVLYPKTCYPHSRTSVLTCYSLTRMGATAVRESENALATEADLAEELASFRDWRARQVPG